MDTIQNVFLDFKKTILLKYPLTRVLLTYDENDDEYFISINDSETYLSEEYLNIVMDFKINRLWSKNIFNVFFVIEIKEEYSFSGYLCNNSNNYIDYSFNHNEIYNLISKQNFDLSLTKAA